MGRQTCWDSRLCLKLGPTSPVLPNELDAIHFSNHGSYVSFFGCPHYQMLTAPGSWTRFNGSTRPTTRSTNLTIQALYAPPIMPTCACIRPMATRQRNDPPETQQSLLRFDMGRGPAYRLLSMHFRSCLWSEDSCCRPPASTPSRMQSVWSQPVSYLGVASFCQGSTLSSSCKATFHPGA